MLTLMYDRTAMAGQVTFATLALLMAAGCHENQVGGCVGAAVLITATPSPATDAGADADAAAPGDGGGADAKPECTGKCDEYMEALRVAIEGATPATCERRPLTTVLACTPSSASGECARDTVDGATSLEAQIRDYLRASWPEIEGDAVMLDTCVCHIN